MVSLAADVSCRTPDVLEPRPENITMKKTPKKLQLQKETIDLLNAAHGGIGTDGTGSDPYSARQGCSKAADCTFTCHPQ
jgi:hypothetical protein